MGLELESEVGDLTNSTKWSSPESLLDVGFDSQSVVWRVLLRVIELRSGIQLRNGRGLRSRSMEVWDLAPGDIISQDGSLREFRYSQHTQCPSAPFNTAESEYLPSQFLCSDSLTTAPLLESEGHECRSEGRCGEISSDSLCLSRDLDAPEEGVRCTPKCGEHIQSGLSCSDSLGLSLFDESRGLKGRECSPRRICCDPRLLEEETQAWDFGLSVAIRSDSDLLSPLQHLQLAPETFDFDIATEDIDLPSLWKEPSKTTLRTAAEPQKSPSLGMKQEDEHPSTTTNQKSSTAFEDYGDMVQRWHNRKRVARAATNHQSSSSNAGILKKLKQTTENTLEPGTLHSSQLQDQLDDILTINDKKNCGQLPDATSPSCDAETTEEDVSGVVDTEDTCESSALRRKLKYPCTRDIKSFWQPVTAPKHVEERKWSCPRKYRPGGRQRTMDSWVK